MSMLRFMNPFELGATNSAASSEVCGNNCTETPKYIVHIIVQQHKNTHLNHCNFFTFDV